MKLGLGSGVLMGIVGSVFVQVKPGGAALVHKRVLMSLVSSCLFLVRVVSELLLNRHPWLVVVVGVDALPVVSDDPCVRETVQRVVAQPTRILKIELLLVGSWVVFLRGRLENLIYGHFMLRRILPVSRRVEVDLVLVVGVEHIASLLVRPRREILGSRRSAFQKGSWLNLEDIFLGLSRPIRPQIRTFSVVPCRRNSSLSGCVWSSTEKPAAD